MSQQTTCTACLHTRKDTDVAPEWQCPNCQRAYAKTGGTLQANVPNAYLTSLESCGDGNSVKWLCIIAIVVLATFILWPAQPESRLYSARCQVKDQFKSFGYVIGLSSTYEDDKQTIANKQAELQAFEEGLQKVEAEIASARVNVGTCSITGQPNQFVLKQDPRPELRAHINELKAEIRALQKKI